MKLDFADPDVQTQLVANHYRQHRPYLAPDQPVAEEFYTYNQVLSDGKLRTCTWTLNDTLSVGEARLRSYEQMQQWQEEIDNAK